MLNSARDHHRQRPAAPAVQPGSQRLVHDADAHLMETPNWLRDHADPGIRDPDRTAPLSGRQRAAPDGQPSEQQRNLDDAIVQVALLFRQSCIPAQARCLPIAERFDPVSDARVSMVAEPVGHFPRWRRRRGPTAVDPGCGWRSCELSVVVTCRVQHLRRLVSRLCEAATPWQLDHPLRHFGGDGPADHGQRIRIAT